MSAVWTIVVSKTCFSEGLGECDWRFLMEGLNWSSRRKWLLMSVPRMQETMSLRVFLYCSLDRLERILQRGSFKMVKVEVQ